PQDRDRPVEPRVPADGQGQGLHPLHRLTLLGFMVAARDIGLELTAPKLQAARRLVRQGIATVSHHLAGLLPQGLYARALIIIIAPIVLLEIVVTFSFMERHWQYVTRRLSEATARDIGALIELYQEYPHKDDYRQLIDLARDRLNLSLQVLPPG